MVLYNFAVENKKRQDEQYKTYVTSEKWTID